MISGRKNGQDKIRDRSGQNTGPKTGPKRSFQTDSLRLIIAGSKKKVKNKKVRRRFFCLKDENFVSAGSSVRIRLRPLRKTQNGSQNGSQNGCRLRACPGRPFYGQMPAVTRQDSMSGTARHEQITERIRPAPGSFAEHGSLTDPVRKRQKLTKSISTTRRQPSASTKRRSLNGSETIVGGSMNIPIETRIDETRRSITSIGIRS